MENPREEIEDVIRGLVCKPTPERQEEVLRCYFSPDVKFFHFIVNDVGLETLIASYQVGDLVVTYQDATFYHILYNERQNVLAVHVLVDIRPLSKLFMPDALHFHLLLELEDCTDHEGNTRKFIKAQRDFFIRSPALQLQPIIGDVYNSESLRFLIGHLCSAAFRVLRSVYTTFVPSVVQQRVAYWT